MGLARWTLLANLLLAPAALADGADEPCPVADTLQGYAEAPVNLRTIGSMPGQLRLYYRLLKPFDPAKRTLLVINGGPGGDFSIVNEFKAFEDDMNVVSFDHRGLGCTKILARDEEQGGYQRGLYSMDRAADDLDALRQTILGKDGNWFVYGVSYGGMLGQKYAIKYPDHITRLILDSTFYHSEALATGRSQYIDLFIVKTGNQHLFDEVVKKYPEARANLLRKIFPMAYSYRGRQGIKPLLESVAAATTADEARQLYEQQFYQGPLAGMQYDILCSEIWDFAASGDSGDWYFPQMAHGCGPYAAVRTPMAWHDDLVKLKVPTFLWSGAFDPVTPSPVMEEMHHLIAGSLFFRNAYTGHGQFFEKPECALKLMRLFFGGATVQTIQPVIDSAVCQSAPNDFESVPYDWSRLTGLKQPLF